MSDVQSAAATMVKDVERLTQEARAEVARLSLAVHAARRDAERAERDADDLDRLACKSVALLETSLAELVAARRRSCDEDLAAELALADEIVAKAGEEAALVAAAALEQAAQPQPEAGEESSTASTSLPVSESVADGESEATLSLEPVAALASVDPQPASEMVLLSADELRELVRASVVVGLHEAMEQAAAMMQLVSPVARPAAPDGLPARAAVVQDIDDEPPFWPRFLHLDVLLPLVAALIVIILFVAWIG